ncbi:MAG TPA: SDR family NAD(P)-dependent oxidoreductase [Polyangiales bacterium]|nr:SDR family NAD(P)-dependent oxidoreductase [Polyangiales bacterium]
MQTRSSNIARTLGLALLGGAACWALVRQKRRIPLRGAVAVVTGGGRGLGYAIARELATAGCKLALCGRDGQTIARAVWALRGRGVEVMGRACDLSDEVEARKFIDDVVEHYGRIDVLINNAAQCFVGPAVELHAQDVEYALRNIFWTQFFPTMAVLPHMRRQRAGRIVNVTSIGGKFPTPHQAAYAAGKFAATGWSETLAVELRKDGIHVSTVTPPPLSDGAPLHAHFNGRAEDEFVWFARTLTSPLRAISAQRTARAVVSAARYGDAERAVSAAAWFASRLQGSAPNLVSRVLSAVDRRLPAAGPPGVRSRMRLGMDVVADSEDARVRALGRAAHADELRNLPQPTSKPEAPSAALLELGK